MLVSAAPYLMKILTVVGTIAMFMVGGGILTHGIHVEKTTCGGKFCDKQRFSDWNSITLQKGCGCLSMLQHVERNFLQSYQLFFLMISKYLLDS